MAGTSPIVRYPNANGDYTAWSLEGGSTTLECVATQDDSKFVRETVAGDRFSVRFPVTGDYEVPSDAANIQVKVYFRLKYYLGAAGMNISQMRNASRGELAVNLIDVDSTPPDSLGDALRAIDGIISVRMLDAA